MKQKENLNDLINTFSVSDCLPFLNNLEDKSINCIITSPPYNLGGDFHTMSKGKRVTIGGYKTFSDNMNEEEYQNWQIDILNECYRVLDYEGVMFYNHKNRLKNGTTISPNDWVYKSKFNVSQIIIINLRTTPNMDKRRFFPVYELLYVLTKYAGKKLYNEDKHIDVWEIKKSNRKKVGHPAAFDIELPLRCIKASTKENDIVLDIFSGSGTVACASYMLKRNFICCDISEEYIELSKQRLDAIKGG